MSSYVDICLQENLETAQKLNSLWRGRKYAQLLQQPFSAAAISSLPKGIKLLQRSAEFMKQLAAAVERCRPGSLSDLLDRALAHEADVAAQQTFLQDLLQHNPVQLAAELLSWLQAWPDLDLADALPSARDASRRVQGAADLLWRGATMMLMYTLQVVHERAAAENAIPNPSLELLEQLVGSCCTTGTPGVPSRQCPTHWFYYQRTPAVQRNWTWFCRFVHAREVRTQSYFPSPSCIRVVLKCAALMHCMPCRLCANIKSAAEEYAGYAVHSQQQQQRQQCLPASWSCTASAGSYLLSRRLHSTAGSVP
jgi:hypothetical protein